MSDKNHFINKVTKKGKKGTIVIDGGIGQNWEATKWEDFYKNTKSVFRGKIAEMVNDGVTELTVEIDSLGGSVQHGISMHDLIASFPGTRITDTRGMTASISTVIGQAATKGKRRISANSLYLIHCASNVRFGNRFKMQESGEDLAVIDAQILSIYTKQAKKSKHKAIKALMESNNGNGKWISPERAKELGLVDEVYEPTETKAVAFAGMVNMAKQLGLPAIPENLLTNNSGSEETEPTKDFSIMGMLTEFSEYLKAQGKKIVDIATNEESTTEELEATLTEENITAITNDVLGNALDPLKAQITELKNQLTEAEKEPEAAAEPVDINATVTAAVTAVLKDAGLVDAKTVKDLSDKVDGLSKDKSKENAENIAMPQAGNGAVLDIEAAGKAGGFSMSTTVEIEEE